MKIEDLSDGTENLTASSGIAGVAGMANCVGGIVVIDADPGTPLTSGDCT